jgi:hypothetical protein
MSASLKDLLAQRRTIIVKLFGDLPVEVTYRPGFLTPRKQAEIQAAAKEETADSTKQAVATFVGFIHAWDLEGDKKGTPVPLTEEGLADVPLAALAQITMQCGEDMTPNARR